MIRWKAFLMSMAAVMMGGNAFAQAPAPAPFTFCGSGSFFALEVVGLTADQSLICVNEFAPRVALRTVPVTGLAMGETLVGIDFRPANGQLYGLGSLGGVYLINSAGLATLTSTLVTAVGGPAVPLMGTSFGVDFNPVPDRLRIISDAGQNLRANVDNGVTLVDGALNNATVAPPTPALGFTAVAYTNNDADPTTNTVLYDIDTIGNQLEIQSPPNAGALNPVGALDVDTGLSSSIDIYTQLGGGTTVQVKALSALSIGTGVQLFLTDLTTGSNRLRGTFSTNVIAIAIPLAQN